MRKKRKTYRFEKKFLFLFTLPLLLIGLSVVGVYVWYQSRALPEVYEDSEMTTLPSDVENVLGVSVGPSSTPALAFRIPIFLYHYVEYVTDNSGKQKYNIPPNILTSQIETLKGAGYTFITPSDLDATLLGNKKLPTKVIILTFDDGYMDFYTDVFPILKEEQVKAVAYIVPDFLDRPNYLFTFQLKEVAKSPLVEIGAHTMDHVGLAGMNTLSATYQITQSRKVLQDMLHLPISSFAYPYGSFDLPAVNMVKAAGFTNAVSVIPGIIQSQDNKYFLYRLRPGYRTGKELVDFLKQNSFQPW